MVGEGRQFKEAVRVVKNLTQSLGTGEDASPLVVAKFSRPGNSDFIYSIQFPWRPV